MQEYNSYLPDFEDDDVVLFDEEQSVMFKVSKLKSVMKAFEENELVLDAHTEFFLEQGVKINKGGGWTTPITFGKSKNCEILKVGAKNWQKGAIRMKVYLEFIPIDSDIDNLATNNTVHINSKELTLDYIRQVLNKDNY